MKLMCIIESTTDDPLFDILHMIHDIPNWVAKMPVGNISLQNIFDVEENSFINFDIVQNLYTEVLEDS